MSEQSVSMLDVVLWAEDEASRIDIWEDVLRREGKCLDPAMVRRRKVAQTATRLLELFMIHRAAFTAMVDKARDEAHAKVAEAQEARTQKAPSTPSAGFSTR